MKLLDYIKGNRKGKDAHRLEKEAMDDPFLADALEGFDAVKGDHAEAIERLGHRVARRSRSRNRKRLIWIAAGAAAVLLLFLTIGNEYLFRDYDNDIDYVATLMEPEKTDTAPEIDRIPEIGILEQEPPADSAVQRQPLAVTSDILNIVRDDREITTELSFADFDQDADFVFEPVRSKEEDEQPEEPFAMPRFGEPARKQLSVQDALAGKVTGVVTDNAGRPVAGATVTIPGTSVGTTTDSGGNFKLPQGAPGQKVEASFLGYETAATTLPADSSPVLIALNESADVLDEVVVVGYGTTRQSTLTGSTSALSAESKSPEMNIPYAQPLEKPDAFREHVRKNRVPQYGPDGEKITGKVVLEFRVNRQGRPAAIRVIESLSPEADAEARRLLESGPDWKRSESRVRVNIDF